MKATPEQFAEFMEFLNDDTLPDEAWAKAFNEMLDRFDEEDKKREQEDEEE